MSELLAEVHRKMALRDWNLRLTAEEAEGLRERYLPNRCAQDRIAQLEAALAEQEAALAAAHEALMTHGVHHTCEKELLAPFGESAPCNCGLDTALSAPALQSAAKLDRLRREVVDAVEAVDLAEDEYTEAVGAMGEQSGGGRARALGRRMDEARERKDAALAALRAEEEKG